MQKVSHEDYWHFSTRFFAGDYKNQRFGQAFLTTFLPNVRDPEVFYGDAKKTIPLILSRYVDFSL